LVAGQTDDAEDPQTQIQAAAQILAKADTQPAVPVAKSDSAKPVAVKTAANGKTVPADDSKTGATKADPANVAADKAGDVKPNPPPAEAVSSGDAPKPAQQPVQAANTNLAAPAIAAPQAQQASPQSGAAPIITQHIQVTAQPLPNMAALAVTIAAKSQSGARQFDIRLDPPELGRVDVRLSIDATGKTSAHLSADQPQTLDLLQKDASVLTRALRDAGLNVSQDGLNFSLRQQAHDGSAGNGNNRGAGRAFSATATISIDPTVTSAAYRARTDGRVDIRV
jgi:flagellar hook-length control protein FliK